MTAAYVDPAEVARALGVDATANADRLAAAAIAGSWYVDRVMGLELPAEPVPLVGPDDGPPWTVEVVAAPAGVHLAALVAAVRFAKSQDVPFGAAGGLGDLAVYVRGTTVPEADLLLVGHRQRFAIA